MTPDQPTPVDQYRFDQEPIRGYPELRWRGKRPFTSTHYYPAQLRERHGPDTDGWRSRIYWGDNLQVMSHLLKEFRGKVQLIYIDPPFDSKAEYKKPVSLRGSEAASDHNAFEEKQYADIWTNDEYLQFMYERLVLLRELLSETGSLYLHCDYRRSHLLKLIMDEVFGEATFLNEIVWVRTSSHNFQSKGFVRANDTILYYTKTSRYTFNPLYTPYGDAQLSRYKRDAEGRLCKAENLTFSTANPARQFEWRGTRPPPNRSWGASLEQLEQWWTEGRILTKQDGTPRLDGLKILLEDTKGSPLTTNWADIGRVGNTSDERTDYPTQKPEELLQRIVKVSSNPGDLVLDTFMGSGTTQAVAMKLDRRFIGTDINLGAVQIATNRLLEVAEELQGRQLPLDGGEPTTHYTGFEVYTVNHYDLFRNPVEARDLLLDALEVQRLPSPLPRSRCPDHLA